MRHALAIALAATLTFTGCGGDDDTETATPADTADTTDDTAPAESTTTAATPLDAALLTLEDMPTGWTTAPEMLEDSDDDDSEGPCGTDFEDETVDEAEAAFKAGDLGPIAFHTVGAFADTDTATRSMSHARDAFADCTTWTDDEGTTFTVSPLSFPAVGDETIALRLTTESEGVPLAANVIVTRGGERLSLFMLFAAFDAPDPEVTERLARLAADRL